ncbi:MAG: hypothetical protein WBA89_03290 [Microcoleus sp.]
MKLVLDRVRSITITKTVCSADDLPFSGTEQIPHALEFYCGQFI